MSLRLLCRGVCRGPWRHGSGRPRFGGKGSVKGRLGGSCHHCGGNTEDWKRGSGQSWGGIQERKITNLIRKRLFNSSQFMLFADFYMKFVGTHCCFSIKDATHSSSQGYSVDVVSAALSWVFNQQWVICLGLVRRLVAAVHFIFAR